MRRRVLAATLLAAFVMGTVGCDSTPAPATNKGGAPAPAANGKGAAKDAKPRGGADKPPPPVAPPPPPPPP